jgi:phosphoglucosamine mutase
LDDAAGRYIEFCKSTFSNDLTLKGLKIVVDAAHGAAYQIAPKVFHELGAEVVAIGCSPDGLNINKDVGATHPAALVQAVKDQRADYGIALDVLDGGRPLGPRRSRAGCRRHLDDELGCRSRSEGAWRSI